MPNSLPALITFLFSFVALRDWLKLIVIGSALEACRRFAFGLYQRFIESFWIRATFQEYDSCYDWMMVWLAKQPSWSKARDVQVSTKTFGLNSSSMLVEGEDAVLPGSRQISITPNFTTTYRIWYKRRLMIVTRIQSEGYFGRKDEMLTIDILTRSNKFLTELLLEAKRNYMDNLQDNVSVYVSTVDNNWRLAASRPKRPLRSIILDPGVKELLINDAREFLESKRWYAERGIPYRRGYLLYGAPGSGKTSIIHSLAGELDLDVYVISLSRARFDDSSLNALIAELPEKCIALMEDIDAAFHRSLNREPEPTAKPEGDGKQAQAPPAGANAPPPPPPPSQITLSGLLNALDGVGAQEGRILFATTNKYSALDPALCRPGRMDLHIEFQLTSRYQARELFRTFYLPNHDYDEDETESEKGSQDSGYSSTSVESDLIELDTEVEQPKVPESQSLTNGHRVAPHLERHEISDLANRFAQLLPDRELSVASLQGYLMSHKTRPSDAVKNFSAWIDKELATRREKSKEAEKQEVGEKVDGAEATPAATIINTSDTPNP